MTSLVVRKVLSRLIFPVPFVLELLLVGMLVARLARHPSRRWFGRFLMVAGFLFLLLYSCPPVADGLLRPLEHRAPALASEPLIQWLAQQGTTAGSTNRVVVGVLGHWTGSDSSRPSMHRLSAEFVVRLHEGVRIFRVLEASGFSPKLRVMMANESIPEKERGEILRGALAEMGLGTNGWRAITGCIDTAWEINTLGDLADGAPLVIATSASHIPRAMLLARWRELPAIAAPATPWTGTSADYEWHCYIPCAAALRVSERAVYEYVGIALACSKHWIAQSFHR